MPTDHRIKPYTGGRFAFELDQIATPSASSTASTAATSRPIRSPRCRGADGYVTKYAGHAKYDDITVQVGAAMSPPFWKWVSSSLKRNPQRRNGALVAYDFDFNERARRSFFGALIAEVGFPALDAASKSAAMLTVKITPELIKYEKGDGHKFSGSQAQDQTTKMKMWTASNFTFALDRFKSSDAARSSVKIEAFSVKQNIIDNPVGLEKYARKEVGRLDLPTIVVTFPEHHMAEWTW